MGSKDILIIFTRNPELGKCKTRLAARIGDEAALQIYKFLLDHTEQLCRNLNADKVVFYSNKIPEADIWDPKLYERKIQEGITLGERMRNAFQWALKMGYHKVVLIGSDLYDLKTEDLENAFEILETNDFALGPASDGGYYLLGMKELKEELFQDKVWGTPTVLGSTLKDMEGESVGLLEERNDVDVYEDIKDVPVFQKFLA